MADADTLERLSRALGQVRAEYSNDDELYGRFALPLYVHRLFGITPSFLVGGRGTGKTTTLRSLAFRGQHRLSGSVDPASWGSIGGYWKAEPTVVSVFRGKGVDPEVWIQVFSHYLNLRLCSLVIDYAQWLLENGIEVTFDSRRIALFSHSCNLSRSADLAELRTNVDLAIVEIESKVNGRVSDLAKMPSSILGKPIEYLLGALDGLGVSLTKPFAFCIDEYENLNSDQQKLLNTLVKQVGGSPYTFKIGVRNKVAIERATMIDHQPLQDPADFTTVDIVTHLKEASFDDFAQEVVDQRLNSEGIERLALNELLPGLTLESEAEHLGAEALRSDLLKVLNSSRGVSRTEIEYVEQCSALDAAMMLRWSQSHSQHPIEVVRFAIASPVKWKNRMGNYGYALLFTIRERRIGDRKLYCGWRTYWQLADGNIRYMLRLVQEALRRHVEAGGLLTEPVSPDHQTRAAKRVGEITVRDLQGWSVHGAALTRLTIGLGGVFGALARSSALKTPEVVQFRVQYSGAQASEADVDAILGEAIGQGVLVDFVGNKEAADRGSPPEFDYQLHPVLAPTFSYSHRSKRRMTIPADELMALAQRDSAPAAFRRILSAHGHSETSPPDQLDLFAGLGA